LAAESSQPFSDLFSEWVEQSSAFALVRTRPQTTSSTRPSGPTT